MQKAISILLALLFAPVCIAQTTRPATKEPPCKKSRGIDVFIDVDARPTALTNDAGRVAKIAPSKSLELLSRVERTLDSEGFCVFYNDEFDSTGNLSLGFVPQDGSPYVELACLTRVESFPATKELLVYSAHFGDWTTNPRLPYYLLDEKTDIVGLAQQLSDSVKHLTTASH
jgi:hypothetical protein